MILVRGRKRSFRLAGEGSIRSRWFRSTIGKVFHASLTLTSRFSFLRITFNPPNVSYPSPALHKKKPLFKTTLQPSLFLCVSIGSKCNTPYAPKIFHFLQPLMGITRSNPRALCFLTCMFLFIFTQLPTPSAWELQSSSVKAHFNVPTPRKRPLSLKSVKETNRIIKVLRNAEGQPDASSKQFSTEWMYICDCVCVCVCVCKK